MPEGFTNLSSLTTKLPVLLDPLSSLSLESLSEDSRARFLCFLDFLSLFFELSHLFHQISHLSGISTAWFLPRGFLCGVEGLSRPVLLAAVLIEPTTLICDVGRERSVNSLAPLAKHVGTALLGVPFLGPSPMLTLLIPGYVATCHFGGCSNLGLIARAFSFVHSTQVGSVTRI
jgi:hypothetical protein